MTRFTSISAVFPAHNDSGTIASMILLVSMALPNVADNYEIIAIDDGSQDSTAKVLAALQTTFDYLRVIHLPHHMGYGVALRAGFAAATQDWIFYADGDAQYDPRELILLAHAWEAGIDLVNGYKLYKYAPLHRRLLNRLYQHLVKRAFKLPIRDPDCDFRLFRRSLLERVQLAASDGTIALELVKKFQLAGCRFAEAPVHYYYRAHGQSQLFNFRRLFRIAMELRRLQRELT